MAGFPGRATALLLLGACCLACCGMVAAAEGEPSADAKTCEKYFTDVKPALRQCQDKLAEMPAGSDSKCPSQCKGVFKDMYPECTKYVYETLPDKYTGKTAAGAATSQFDICEMLFCPAEECGIALEVLRSLALFNLPDNMPAETGSSSSVNVGGIVAGVVVGNACMVLLIAGFVWLKRHRRECRLRAEQAKALELAPGATGLMGPDGTIAYVGNGAMGGSYHPGALDAAERGDSGKQAVAQLWAQAAAQGAGARWQPPPPPASSPAQSSTTLAASHMQQDELEIMRYDSGMSATQRELSGVHSDPLLTWVSGQLMQQQGSQGEQALGPAPEASAESLGSPAAGSSEALSTPTAGEVERQASGESQAAAGSNTALARPPGAGTSSRRRSSGWVGLDASRSSGLVDLKPWQLKYSELRIQRPLGEGSFGKVFLATWNETIVAVKLLISTDDAAAAARSSSSSGSGTLSLPLPVMEALQKEAGLMASLRHPNVVLFLGVCASPPAVVTEYCSRGSLLDVLRNAHASEQGMQQLTWVRRLSMALDAAKGMLCLHVHNPPILHRDLKSPNLLVDAAWRVKVCDFNLSKLLEESVRSSSAGGLLNPRWLAPEVLMGQNATAASDVFSFGTVLWELLTWQLPWEGANLYQLVFMVSRGERLAIPAGDKLPGAEQLLPDEFGTYVALIQRCWAQDPSERPSFADIITELRAILTKTFAASAAAPASPSPANA